MKIKAVCFDMDGVVVDTMSHHVEAWRYAFNKKGYDHEDLVFYTREGMPGKKTIEDIFKSSGIDFTEQEVEEIYLQKRDYFKNHAKYSFIEEAVSLLKTLYSQGVTLALVTGSRKEFVSEVLSELPITFHSIITGDDVIEGKPSPEPYLLVMNEYDYQPYEWLVIENAPLGIESAKCAGAYCLAVETTLEEEYLKRADMIIKPSELQQTVEGLLKKR